MAQQQPPSPRPPHAAVRPISPALGVGCCSTPARASNLVGAILAGVLSIVLAPAIFALVVSPIVLLGLACSSHARTWLRVDWSPCVKLLAVLVDIALAVIAVGTHLLEHIVLQPVALLAYSLLRAPVALPWNPQPDAEAPACAHSRGGLGASAASSAARARARRPIRPTYSGRRPESSEGDRYRGHASVWEALEGDGQKVLPGDVRLLSLRWLVEHADKGEALPRRQSVPEEAFLDVARLKEIEGGAKRRLNIFGLITAFTELGLGGGISSILSTLTSVVRRKRNPDGLLPIISISYCWLEAAHPDREGHQLQLLCRKLQSLHGGRGLLAACRDYGFTDMGVFIDWASGHQKDPALWRAWMADRALYARGEDEIREAGGDGGERMVSERRAYEESRSREEKAAFDRMLNSTMDLWYAHSAITVVLLTQLPDELPAGFDATRSYHTRGWTTFERCSAELAKCFSLHSATWKLVIDVADEGGGAQRRLPTTPERMATLLSRCHFTDGADVSRVISLYERTANAVLGTIEEIEYMGLPLVRGDKWCSPARLAEALNYCARLRSLMVVGTRLDDDGVAELAAGLKPGALPALEILNFAGNYFGARGIASLCDVFGRGVAPRLKGLLFPLMPIGDDGAAAVAAALTTGDLPRKLALCLNLCDVGDEGARAIADALPHAGQGCQVNLALNRFGIASQLALLEALEAKRHAALLRSGRFRSKSRYTIAQGRFCERGSFIAHYFAVMQLYCFPWDVRYVRALARGWRRTVESGRVHLA